MHLLKHSRAQSVYERPRLHVLIDFPRHPSARLQVESFLRLVVRTHQRCEIVSREINDTISAWRNPDVSDTGRHVAAGERKGGAAESQKHVPPIYALLSKPERRRRRRLETGEAGRHASTLTH